MLFFALHRVSFLILYHRELMGISFSHIMLSFVYGLSLDISASCYLMVLPLLLFSAGMMLKKGQILFAIANWVNYLLIILCLVINFIGLGLYASWGQKINSKAISFLIYPKEMKGIMFDWNNLLYFVGFLIFVIGTIFLYRKLIKPKQHVFLGYIRSSVFLVVFTFCLLIGARGGFQRIPINKSWSYYSKHCTLNFASVNDFWNFFEIIVKPQMKHNPYNYMDKTVAQQTISGLYKTAESSEYIAKTKRPNIVLVIMESMSADAIACFGGEPGIAPKFDSLSKEGLIFTNYYATGYRTDQGMGAIICSFPAQPVTDVMNDFGKFDYLPNLIKTMDKNGYRTSYYFGGELDFAHTNTFLTVSGTDVIVGKQNVPHKRETDWGAYDEDVYAYQLKEISREKQPFFSMIMTITNHEYFTADVEKIVPGNTELDRYHNTAHYADKCVYNYIQEAKTHDWYNNTLFIITGDHAHPHPRERKYNEVLRHHIPLLICGGALKDEYRGKVIAKTGCQLDMAATILGQLGINSSEFKWSKNNLNKYSKGFAFYTFDNGFGFVTDSAEVVYDHNLKSTITSISKYPGANPAKTLNEGKAMLQMVFEQYVGM